MIDEGYIRDNCIICGIVLYRIEEDARLITTYCPNCGAQKLSVYDRRHRLKHYKNLSLGLPECEHFSEYVQTGRIDWRRNDGDVHSWSQAEIVVEDFDSMRVVVNDVRLRSRFGMKASIEQEPIFQVNIKRNEVGTLTRIRKNYQQYKGTFFYINPTWLYTRNIPSGLTWMMCASELEKLQGTMYEEAAEFAKAMNDLLIVRVNLNIVGDDMQGDFVAQAIMEWIRHPVLRTLFKHGFLWLCFDLIYRSLTCGYGMYFYYDAYGVGISSEYKPTYADINVRGKTISKILRTPVQIIDNITTREDFRGCHLEKIKWLQKHNVPITAENVRLATYNGLGAVEQMMPKNYSDYSRLFKYLRNQCRRHPDESTDQIFHSYRDYLSVAVDLSKYPDAAPICYYPTDILDAETAIVAKREAARTDMFNAGIKAMAGMVDGLSMARGGLCIVVPASSEDLVKDGQALNHCVGNYASRVAAGESLILFVRKAEAPDVPFYTLELKPDKNHCTVVQCRTFRNASYDQDPSIKAFVEGFVAEYNARGTADAPHPVAYYYKAVRRTDKDGVYISLWDNKTEYIIGKTVKAPKTNTDPDKVAVEGIHMASLEYACRYGLRSRSYCDVAILELSVDVHDTVIPDTEDQIRATKAKVMREVPNDELPEEYRRRVA